MVDVDARRSGVAGSLVGRTRELDRIRSFLDRAATGGEALLLSGEPGVGKTVLLDAAAETASASGTRLLRAAGAEFETAVAFSGLRQLLLPLTEEFDRLAPAHLRALSAALGIGDDAPADRLTTFTAVLALLRGAAAARPLLVIVDDLHWLDRSSTAALGFVARRLAGSRIGLLAASRTAAASFLDSSGLPEDEVQPLDEDAAAGLLGARFPTLAAAVRRRVLAEAEGNPLALLELPAVITAAQRIAREALPTVLPLSRRLRMLFASRVTELPAATRRVLLLAALEGTGDLGVLQAAARGRALCDLQPAERDRLVGVDQGTGRLVFRHPLVRSTVVGFATEEDRRWAHRALADVLTDDPELRAWHLADATPGPDERVARLLEHVARRVLGRGDGVGAVAAMIKAADLSPAGADRSRRLTEAAYVGANVTGQLRTVPQLLEDARRADPDSGGSLQAAVTTAHLLLNGEGDVETAHRVLVGAIETEGGDYRADDRALVEALYTLLQVCFVGDGRPELWAPLTAAVERLQPEAPTVLALCATTFTDPARATAASVDEVETIIRGLSDVGDPVQIIWTGRAAFFLDRMTECREPHWRLVRDGREGRAVTSGIAAAVNLCLDDLLTGRWTEAQELADEGLRLCALHGYRLIEWPFWFGQAFLAGCRGDVERATDLADRMTRWAEPRGAALVLSYSRCARALAALGQGNAEEAFRNVAAISAPGTLAPRTPLAFWCAIDLVESAIRTRRPAAAAAHVAAMEEAGIGALSPRLALVVRGAAAMTAPADRAAGLFEEALAVRGVERWPFDLARVRLAYGERLRRDRAAAEARLQLTAALDTFDRLGARPWATRAGAELRAAGAATSSSTERAPESLTAQEREIALLAATGLTNKEIGHVLHLSHRTVGANLYRVFPKLGITSRAALRDALRSDGCEPER
ncbi:helix-turn-helix transcriptional regulator [Pseudonocardia xinjiangensis]|uniref:helix-turn-helix transcriptional regulator n=1 Tax=Pseudonocardia xinjiangensis TaxID=75289 RepID=UPI003D8DCEEB